MCEDRRELSDGDLSKIGEEAFLIRPKNENISTRRVEVEEGDHFTRKNLAAA